MKTDEVNFQQVGNSASTELVGSCHDKKLERVGNSASTQLVGSCHDNKSDQVGNSASTQLVGFCHDNKSELGCLFLFSGIYFLGPKKCS